MLHFTSFAAPCPYLPSVPASGDPRNLSAESRRWVSAACRAGRPGPAWRRGLGSHMGMQALAASVGIVAWCHRGAASITVNAPSCPRTRRPGAAVAICRATATLPAPAQPSWQLYQAVGYRVGAGGCWRWGGEPPLLLAAPRTADEIDPCAWGPLAATTGSRTDVLPIHYSRAQSAAKSGHGPPRRRGSAPALRLGALFCVSQNCGLPDRDADALRLRRPLWDSRRCGLPGV
ncbi:hypothetical protein NDU88_000978 [Pleurodeles waltl]|uniref:Uncharacterized protein n=1 Tax=Pleurodeles waltl TaxID=8319 RepID=A0AAV7MJ50_PLEWA|nr:hypothetical protein NDU88_000978 [Pleurodeles waltl]